jgi:hypothetical protein
MSDCVEFVLNGCGGMDEADVRRVLGRKIVTGEMVMAVLHFVRLWGGLRVTGSGRVVLDCVEFGVFADCLLNKVMDQEACDYLKSQMNVDVEPDDRPVQFNIPDELKDDQRIKAAREKAAFLNFEQRLELEARKNWRQNVRLRREERKAAEQVPPVRPGRWSESEDFAVEVPPADWEDRVSFSFLFNVYFTVSYDCCVRVERQHAQILFERFSV